MKVLLVLETLIVGGAETFVIRLCNELCHLHQVYLFVMYKHLINEELIMQLDKKVELVVPNIKFRGFKQKVDSLFRKFGLDYSIIAEELKIEAEQCIKRIEPDVVHTNLFKTDYLFSRLKEKNKFRYKHISTIHGDYSSFYYGEANPQMNGFKDKLSYTLSSLDAVVCICEEHRQFFFKNFYELTHKKIKLIYNGYKASSQDYLKYTKGVLKLPAQSLLIGMVSRGVRKKGWEKAIEAFQKAALPDAVLVLVGWSDYMAQLKEQYDSQDILFAGFTVNPLAYIQHFDICLLPSLFHYESLPTVIMEYLYCNKPIIATDVGEIKKMITDENGNQAGILLQFYNGDFEMSEFVAALKTMGEEIERSKYAKIAGGAFNKFTMDKCLEDYLKLYQSA